MRRPPFADPKTDIIFKRIFGEPGQQHLLTALLNDLLELPDGDLILSVEYLSEAQRPLVAELKFSVVDVKCRDQQGRQYVVEMQLLNVEAFEKRVVYNVAKAFTIQLSGGARYAELCDVIGVTICDFELWPDSERKGAPLVPMVSRWRMQEQHGGALGLSQIQHVFVELPKYRSGDNPSTHIEKWVYFFREAENLAEIPPVLGEGSFAKAMEEARAGRLSDLDWEAYDSARMAEQDQRGAIALADRVGREEGERRGREEGERRGRELGREEGERRGREVGQTLGRSEGEAMGLGTAILAFLDARGIRLTAADRDRILAMKDRVTLDVWLQRAVAVVVVEELWG